ncbi:MAG: sulfur carrier protein ThiS [Lysobacteraceae bacterium]|nr:MAG: sulfur carrier protein ThiS [Xanthomonadaceae bacterium]
MHVIVNGQTLHFPTPPLLSEVLDQLGLAERRIAVEVNRAIVPRSEHASFRLADGDRVELVQAMGGG